MTATLGGNVRCLTKVAGGTTIASTQTSMVCTWGVPTRVMECAGTTGNTITSLLRDPRWRFVQKNSDYYCQDLHLSVHWKYSRWNKQNKKIKINKWLWSSFLYSFLVFNWQPENSCKCHIWILQLKTGNSEKHITRGLESLKHNGRLTN